MTTAPPTDWNGTPQHPNARDLSQFLIHLTRTEADLASITTHGVIEARAAYGVAKNHHSRVGGQKSVCFTEMPVAELTRMVPRGRQFGIMFAKERLRERGRAQPVWYVSDPSPQYSAVLNSMKSTTSSDSIWQLTPFIEGVRSCATGSMNDWRWEREWRVVGDFEFEIEDIAAILIPTPSGDFKAITEVQIGVPYITSGGDFYWTGAFTEATDAAMELLVERFREHWLTVDDAGLPLDRESEWGYAEVVPIHELDDAVLVEFGDFPAQVRDALVNALVTESDLWCSRRDIESVGD